MIVDTKFEKLENCKKSCGGEHSGCENVPTFLVTRSVVRKIGHRGSAHYKHRIIRLQYRYCSTCFQKKVKKTQFYRQRMNREIMEKLYTKGVDLKSAKSIMQELSGCDLNDYVKIVYKNLRG